MFGSHPIKLNWILSDRWPYLRNLDHPGAENLHVHAQIASKHVCCNDVVSLCDCPPPHESEICTHHKGNDSPQIGCLFMTHFSKKTLWLSKSLPSLHIFASSQSFWSLWYPPWRCLPYGVAPLYVLPCVVKPLVAAPLRVFARSMCGCSTPHVVTPLCRRTPGMGATVLWWHPPCRYPHFSVAL